MAQVRAAAAAAERDDVVSVILSCCRADGFSHVPSFRWLVSTLLALAAPQGSWVDASHRAGPHVQIGRTKVFMREATARQLEVAREEARLAHRAVHPA